MLDEKIKIGSRNSKLARWQTHFVARQLEKNGVFSEIIEVETKGDKILDVSISKIGSKGVFTEELESMLKDGMIDIAIHSAKDLQSDLGNDLEIIAYTEREKANDVLVSFNKTLNLNGKESFQIGTSSTRRVALIKHHYPHVGICDMRGNLQTRITKMKDGQCDALLLAYAGVHRMSYNQLIIDELSLDQFTPAVGQGCIAVQSSTNLDVTKKMAIRKALNHRETEKCLLTERTFLKKLEGGCSIPVFGICSKTRDRLRIKAGIISLDGTKKIEVEKSGPDHKPEDIGLMAAESLLSSGGEQILNEIKNSL